MTDNDPRHEAAALIASLAPGGRPTMLRDPLAEDESRWFIKAVESGLLQFRECPTDCFRFKKWGVVGPDHFDTPAGKPRHLFSKPASETAWLNREYVPHIAAYARTIQHYGYAKSRASFSLYRKYGRDLITKKAGGSYETDLEFADADGRLGLHIEVKRGAREIERMAVALEQCHELAQLPVNIVKEIEYVLDLRPDVLWLVGPGTVDPAKHVFRVHVDGLDAKFTRLPDVPTPGPRT